MKNKLKLFGLLIVTAMLLFACSTGNNGNGNGNGISNGDITYVAFQKGGSASTAEATTSIMFIFSKSITSLSDNNITVTNGTGNVSRGTLSGSGASRELKVTTQTSGEVTVSITAEGFDNDPQTILVFASDFVPAATQLKAADLVAGMKVGWNLGNTLDCSDLHWLTNPSVTQMETAWGNPVTTQANIDALSAGGFNTLRIPVSWTKAADANYNIRADWMARVKDVVDYAVNNDMYIILNTHHDEDVFKFENSNYQVSLVAFGKIWKQIADAFKDYDYKLVFEGLNEPRTKGSSAEWNGGTAAERTNLNSHYQVFVDIVRASGGNNSNRVLMINTYAASGEAAAINGLVLPNDTVADRLIVSYHAYAPYNFALNKDNAYKTWSASNANDTSSITNPMNRAVTAFVNKGIPVVIGEFGAMNKDNAAARAAWAEYYVKQARDRGMPCIWWDNGVTTGADAERFGLLNRTTNQFVYTEIVAALMKGAAGN